MPSPLAHEPITTGMLFIISAPSGAGKTSLVKALLESTMGIEAAVSHTTRPKREQEKNGVHYHFVDQSMFQAMVDKNAFLEHAKVFENYYGTSHENVVQRLQAGMDVILEIDWQGARQIRGKIPHNVSIFILPPSRATLQQRLQTRAQDSDEVIAKRMADAENELSHYQEFDYLLINDDFDKALNELRTIILAQRFRCSQQKQRWATLLADLLA